MRQILDTKSWILARSTRTCVLTRCIHCIKLEWLNVRDFTIGSKAQTVG